MVKRREDLTTAAAGRRLDVTYDSDAFGQFSESIARYLGTARFLVWQSVDHRRVDRAQRGRRPTAVRFDPWGRGLVLLTLRAVAPGVVRGAADPAGPEPPGGPRPDRRPRLDRDVAERTQADTEFLAREIAGVRLMLADAVTGDELREQLSRPPGRGGQAEPASRRARASGDARRRRANGSRPADGRRSISSMVSSV